MKRYGVIYFKTCQIYKEIEFTTMFIMFHYDVSLILNIVYLMTNPTLRLRADPVFYMFQQHGESIDSFSFSSHCMIYTKIRCIQDFILVLNRIEYKNTIKFQV